MRMGKENRRKDAERTQVIGERYPGFECSKGVSLNEGRFLESKKKKGLKPFLERTLTTKEKCIS